MPTTAPPPSTAEPVLLSVADVARMLSVSVRHVWRLRDSGDLPAPIYLGRTVRWRKAALDRWIAECSTTRPRYPHTPTENYP